MDHIPDFSNTPSHPLSRYVGNSKLPADTSPDKAAAGIFSYYMEAGWSRDNIRRLAERVINQCDGGILESTREVVVSHFAELLDMDPTTFLTSSEVHHSFALTLGSEFKYSDLSIKLSKDQALCIAKSIMGKTPASNLEDDSRSRGGSVDNFSFNVIKKICQMKGRYYSIQNFLDELKNPDAST